MRVTRAFLVLLLGALLIAVSGGSARAAITDVTFGNRAAAPADPGLALVSSFDARDELVAAASDPARDGERSTGIVTLASLAIPGTGQLLKGEKRGYAYLLAEIAFWAAYASLNQDGLDVRDEYEEYARDEWHYEEYVAYYDQYCVDCGMDCPEGCRPLAPYGTQEYYEDIGKYSVYWPWWELDGDEGVPGAEMSEDDLATRGDYWTMRKDSNRSLRNARYFMTAAFLNHIVSAADAFLTTRSAPAAADLYSERTTGLVFDVADGGAGLRCALVTAF